MNKKLIAVAVAGMFAAPTAALAQSSVTISGVFKGGYESLKLSNGTRANNSQNGVVDDSSRIVFNVVEDLGGGLQAIGQADIRIKPDDAGGVNSAGTNTGAFNTGNIVNGNTHFGLRSKQWGRIFIGRQDLHYFNTESNISDKGSLRASSVSLLSYIDGTAIAGATRTQNVVHYTTPNWGGFTAILAYSSSPNGQDADIGSGIRKGSAWNFNPNFAAANWQIGYSYWSSKPDGVAALNGQLAGSTVAAVGGSAALQAAAAAAAVAATGPAQNQRADRLYGSYVFPFGLKIGLAWDSSKLKNAASGVQTHKRDAWSLPVSYAWGNHTVHVNYSKAGDNKDAAGNSGAEMWAVAYSYDLSKRTSAALTYARINNKNADGSIAAGAGNGGAYNFFTSGSLGIGGSAGAIQPGEDPKMWGVTLRHAF